jgi:DNA-directed RNA polymerase subunit RPC12/RpoP
MQEDILGTQRTALTQKYVICSRCGKATRLRYARVVPADVFSDTKSEFEYLCPDCQKALASGEKDLPLV